MLVTDTCTLASETGVSETDDDESWIVNGAACRTVRLKLTEWLIDPLVPVTVTVEVAMAVLSDAVS